MRKQSIRMTSSFSNKPNDVLLKMTELLLKDPSKADTVLQKLDQRAISQLQQAVDTIGTVRIKEPTKQQLSRLRLQGAIPFIGFGFMDNMVMILAGDYIDLTFGVSFGLSTMAAAGFGNLVSDLAGLGLGGLVEQTANKLGLPASGITQAQSTLSSVKRAHYTGCSVGVTIGCLLGMFPLLFLKTRQDMHIEEEES